MLIAPDTLGHGDSVPSTEAEPEIVTYANATIRLLDALGIDRVALYGAHTGARIAVETAVLHPDRIDRLILDGIGEYRGEIQADLLAHYAPAKSPDDYGTQMMWAFHFIRDQALHFPHYARDPAHRLMSRAVPDADDLHESTLEVLKGLRTYHHAYRAAFRYPTRERLALLRRPLTLLEMESELPTLRTQMQELVEVAKGAVIEASGWTMADKAAAIRRVLDW
jgi:pimeloyl-ACP methyl ester carboxylesterase